MPAIRCPHCDTSIDVPISRAGGEVSCPSCSKAVTVPKLGELRRLEASTPTASTPSQAGVETATSPLAKRAGFVALVALAAACLGLGGFCLVRYWAIAIPGTTESHIEMVESQYSQAPASQLVREWQELESFGEDVAFPYPYETVAAEKADWLRKGWMGIAGALVAALLAGAIASFSGRSTSHG
jgi:hypothetical protein